VPLDTAQCVLPIPFRLIKKAVRGSIGHERHLDNNAPVVISLPPTINGASTIY
jgi:hypothetical protein